MGKELPEVTEETKKLLIKDIERSSKQIELNSLELVKTILKINMGALALSLTILSFLKNTNLVDLYLLKWSWILLSSNLLFITLGYKLAIKEWDIIRERLQSLFQDPTKYSKFRVSIYGKFANFFDNLGLIILYLGCGLLMIFAWKNITYIQETPEEVITTSSPAVILTEESEANEVERSTPDGYLEKG